MIEKIQLKAPVEPGLREILALHAAVDNKSLWNALRRILEKLFPSNNSIMAMYRFVDWRPTILNHTRYHEFPREWWAEWVIEHRLLGQVLKIVTGSKCARVTEVLSEEEIEANPFYQKFLVPEGTFYGLGIFFWRGGATTAVMSVQRTRAQGDFTDAELRLVRKWWPHLNTAIQRVAKLESARLAADTLFHHYKKLPIATAVLSWAGDVIFQNDRATELLGKWRPGVGIPAQILATLDLLKTRCASAMRERHQLDTGLAADIAHPSGDLSARLQVLPGSRDDLGLPCFLLQLDCHGSDQLAAPPPGLASLMELTPAERQLAGLLYQGMSNKEIAASLGKSTGTVKIQLQSAFRKLGVRSRTEMVRLLGAGDAG